jgi:hypothetical protein
MAAIESRSKARNPVVPLALRSGISAGLLATALSACGGGGGGAAGGAGPSATSATSATPAASSPGTAVYDVALTLSASNNTLVVGSAYTASLLVSNSGASSASAAFRLSMPSGLAATAFTNDCGGALASSGTSELTVSAATVPAGGACKFGFTVTAPQPSDLPPSNARTFTVQAVAGTSGSTLGTVSAPTIRFIGNTPGLYAWWSFPKTVTALSELDMYITPGNDPGPNSNVYWSNQVDGLNGYTGLQTTELGNGAEGFGKQFLFSLWGATNAQTGTPASAGIGAGSFCTVSATATDGSAGAQCRYRYEWQVGHTYRFRVTPDAALGDGWFKSNVTDVTGGAAGDSFDIGSIFIGASKKMIPVSSLSQWTEYFDWNSERTTCSSVPQASAQMKVEALDDKGNPVTMPAPSVNPGSCKTYVQESVANGVVTELGGPQQSARGFVSVNGQCLKASLGLSDGSATQPNLATLASCPLQSDVQAHGGGSYDAYLWVLNGDGNIETKRGYCLTAPAGGTGVPTVKTCVAGEADQLWSVTQGAGTASVKSSASTCLVPSGAGVALAACAAGAAVWRVPGSSFSY